MKSPRKLIALGSKAFGRRSSTSRKNRKTHLNFDSLETRVVPAALAVKIESGSTTVIVDDGGAGDLDGAVNNQIVLQSGVGSPSIPGFNVQFEAALTNSPGSSTGALLQTGYSVASIGTAGGTVTVTTSATGFDQPSSSLNPLTLTNQFDGNGSGTGTIAAQTWADPSNSMFGMGPDTPGLQGPFDIGASGGYTSSATKTFERGLGAYSLTTQFSVTLASGAITTGSLIERVPTPQVAAIGDFVWGDLNANGIQDSGETGVAGAKVELFKSDNTLVATQTTLSDGLYLFTGLTPGDYYVKVTPPPGYFISPQDQGINDAVDSDANPATGVMATTTLTAGEVDLTWDAGLYKLASLGDFVWHDLDADGVQDALEPGISGVTVKLLKDNVLTGATTTTNGSGLYAFTGLVPGNYSVQFVQPGGFTQVSPANVGSDASDSDGDTTLTTAQVTLTSGDNNTTLDQGFYNLASLGDFVWVDLNANGIQDAGDLGKPGVTVNLLNAGGSVIATDVTDINGLYLFENLVPGTYSVEFVAPSGYLISPQDQGSDDAKDSDANTANGKTGPYTLVSGETNLTVDAGLYKLASIGDFVWNDKNADGKQDVGEPGIPGVTVKLLDSAGNAIAGKVTTTDINGKYLFDNLTPGTYGVQFIAPSGYVPSPKDQGADDLKDSDADTITGKTGNYLLTSGQTDLSVDAGYNQPAKIDIEKYVKEVPVTGGGEGLTPGYWKQPQHFATWVPTGYSPDDLFNTVFGVNDPDNPTLLEALETGGGGFNALGRHAVAALLNSAHPTVEYAFTTAQVISQVQAAYANPATVESAKDVLATQNEKGADLATNDGSGTDPDPSVPGSDADTPPGLIVQTGNYVTFTYYVTNPGAVELQNIVVTDDHETPGDGSDDFNPTPVLKAGGYNTGDTDSDGKLDPGEKWIYITPDSTLVTAGQHTNIADVVGTPVGGGNPVDDEDAANWLGLSDKDGSISGKKYFDVSGNGLNLTSSANSPADTPLQGTTIYLDMDDDKVKDPTEPSTVTDANGSYVFTGLTPGSYNVREVVPAGYLRTFPVLSDVYNVLVTNGSASTGNDFANTEKCEPNTISNVSFLIKHADNTTETVTDLRGRTKEGDTITVTFKVNGDHPHDVTFVSYTAPDPIFVADHASQQQIFEVVTQTFNPGGPYTLTIHVPNCYYQVDFVCGLAINQLGPAGSNIFYTPQMRLVSADNGGTHMCGTDSGSISGYKFKDLDADGIWDSGEPGLSGWTIYADLDGDSSKDANEPSAVTGSNGYYKLDGLPGGTYTIREVGQSTWIASLTPSNVVLPVNGTVSAVNFGNYQNGKISGYKFNDKNADGVWDKNGLDNCLGNGDDEVPLSNWQIFLDLDKDGTWDSGEPKTTTDANGFYKFENLKPSLYEVREIMQTGWVRTTDDADISLVSGQNAANINIGNFKGNLVMTGDTATIGFWQNKNGQALINCLNGGPTAKALGNWLAANFPNLYGSGCGSNNMAGKTNSQVAAYFVTLFNKQGQKLGAQILATALAVYVTDSDLAGGTHAAKYGFTVNTNGVGADYYNIGANGAAFGVVNDSLLTVWDILKRTNARAVNGVYWNGNQTYQNMGNVVFTGINESGDIK